MSYTFHGQRDNAAAVLAYEFAPGDAEIQLRYAQGGQFGPIVAGQPIRVTLYHPSALSGGFVVDPSMVATYNVPGISGDDLLSPTFQRGNSTLVFPAGSVVVRAITRDDFAEVHDAVNDLAASGTAGVSISSPNSTVVVGGTASLPTLDVNPATLAAKLTAAGGDASATVVTATGSTAARTAAARAADVYNVKDFGAAGDGTHDDTQAFLACIFKAIGSPGYTKAAAGDLSGAIADDAADALAHGRLALKPMFVPSGTYKITRQIPIWSVLGLHLHGEGYATRLIPAFTTSVASFLDINGAAFSTFELFTIEGTGYSQQIGSAIRYYYDDTTAARSSSECTFSKINIANTRCTVGFEVGLPGSPLQVDTSSYYDIVVTGAWDGSQTDYYQQGFRVGGNYGNNLVHTFVHAAAVLWARAIEVTATQAAFFVSNFSNNGTDFYLNSLNYVNIDTVRSENAGRFLDGPVGSTSVVGNVTIANVHWVSSSLASGGAWFRTGMNGSFTLRSCQIIANNLSPQIAWTPSKPSTLYLEGLAANNTVAGLLSACNDYVEAKNLSYVERNSGASFVKASTDLVTTTTGSLTLSAQHHTVYANASGGSVPITLPPASHCNVGRDFVVVNSGASGTPTLVPSGSDTIPGTYSLSSQWSTVRLVSDGVSTWTATPIGGIQQGGTASLSTTVITQSGSTAGLTVQNGTNPKIVVYDPAGTNTLKMQAVGSTGYVGTESNNRWLLIGNNTAQIYMDVTGVRIANPVRMGDTSAFASSTEQLRIVNTAATNISSANQAAASQSANIEEWRNSTNTVLSSVDKNGYHCMVAGAGAPGTNPANAGALYYDTTNNKLYAWNGSAWKSATLT